MQYEQAAWQCLDLTQLSRVNEKRFKELCHTGHKTLTEIFPDSAHLLLYDTNVYPFRQYYTLLHVAILRGSPDLALWVQNSNFSHVNLHTQPTPTDDQLPAAYYRQHASARPFTAYEMAELVLSSLVPQLPAPPDLDSRPPWMQILAAAGKGCVSSLFRDHSVDEVIATTAPHSTFSVFHAAAANGQLDLLKELHNRSLFQEVIAYRRDDGDWTPLHWACRRGHLETAKWLLSVGQAEFQNPTKFQLPAKVAPPLEAVDGSSANALLHACDSGHLEIVGWILTEQEAVAPAKLPEKRITTALGRVSSNQGPLNASNFKANNALHRACLHGRLEIAKFLIEVKNMNASPRNKLGRTPMLVAAEGGHLAILNYLMEQTIKQKPKNPVSWAVTGEGAINKEADSNGNTVVLIACFFGHLDVLKFALGFNPDLARLNAAGHGIWLRCAANNQVAAAEWLLKNQQRCPGAIDINRTLNEFANRYAFCHWMLKQGITTTASYVSIRVCEQYYVFSLQAGPVKEYWPPFILQWENTPWVPKLHALWPVDFQLMVPFLFWLVTKLGVTVDIALLILHASPTYAFVGYWEETLAAGAWARWQVKRQLLAVGACDAPRIQAEIEYR
eukprot:TRINITY_DN60545_c0_g1_i1.p1 TRINITY_DN60545_c0_g1~~TRINITY_DN60545_c0_g1_i1.p1  ORF type:complete len:616 (-),score=35.05 TRINITY_DN60545_c0_g1_i1:51-1898(-)